MKFLVEKGPDVFESVKAYAFTIEAGGVLAFVDMRGNLIEARAAGTWRSIVKDADEDQ
jgi:hypothetical protein